MHHYSIQQRPPRIPARRSGSILVVALVVLSVALLVLAAVVRLVLLEQRSARGMEHRLQAEWLAEAGRERARLAAADSAYTGETWEVAADQLGGGSPGRVVIRVQRLESGEPRIDVETTYPLIAPSSK